MDQFLEAMDWHAFAVEASASLLGASVGGLVALAIAMRTIRADRRVREAEAEERARERALAEATRLRGVRAEAINDLLLKMTDSLEYNKTFLPNRRLDIAIGALLSDGHEDSYDIYRWVRWMCRPPVPGTGLTPTVELVGRYDQVRAMLLGWMRSEDEGGVLSSIRRQLEDVSDD